MSINTVINTGLKMMMLVILMMSVMVRYDAGDTDDVNDGKI